MSEDVEQIEAKLCAFVDGQLSAGECAEIEEHLAGSPSHRALLQDLMAQREILRSLPRERAPGDLAEPLQAQLEREALLAVGLADDSGAVVRLRRWPQALAVAAIVLLSIGLGTAVYFILPPAHPAVSIVAPTAPAGELGGRPAPAVDTASVRAAADTSVAAGNETGSAGEQPGAVVMGKGDPRAAASAAVPRARVNFLSLRESSGGRGGAVTIGNPELLDEPDASQTLLVMVKAADIELANNSVVNYLSENQIAWAEGDAYVSSPENGAQVPEAIEQTMAAALPVGVPATQGVEPAVAMRGGQAANQADVAAAPAAPGEATRAVEQAAKPIDPRPWRGLGGDVRAAAATGGFAGAGALHEAISRMLGNADEVTGRQLGRSIVLSPEQLDRVRGSRVIVARNLRSEQLAELTAAISRVQAEKRFQPNAELLITTVRPAQTQPVHVQAGGEAGAEVALGRPVAVRGQREEEVAGPRRMMATARSAARVPEPGISKDAGTYAFRQGLGAPSTQAGQAGFMAAPPATQPAAVRMQPGEVAAWPGVEGRFDLLIVLEDANSAAGQAVVAPATQPAEAPTTQPAE